MKRAVVLIITAFGLAGYVSAQSSPVGVDPVEVYGSIDALVQRFESAAGVTIGEVDEVFLQHHPLFIGDRSLRDVFDGEVRGTGSALVIEWFSDTSTAQSMRIVSFLQTNGSVTELLIERNGANSGSVSPNGTAALFSAIETVSWRDPERAVEESIGIFGEMGLSYDPGIVWTESNEALFGTPETVDLARIAYVLAARAVDERDRDSAEHYTTALCALALPTSPVLNLCQESGIASSSDVGPLIAFLDVTSRRVGPEATRTPADARRPPPERLNAAKSRRTASSSTPIRSQT